MIACNRAGARFGEHAARELADSKEYDRALAVVNIGLRQVPTSAELLGLRWRIALAMKDWRTATAAGEELLTADSSAANADFFPRYGTVVTSIAQALTAYDAGSTALVKHYTREWAQTEGSC